MIHSATCSAPAKAILLGEHAVVYGRPALAVPVSGVRAVATANRGPGGIRIHATDLGRIITIGDPPAEPGDAALAVAVIGSLAHIGLDPHGTALDITIHSDIPIASGMGSGAAVAIAIIRAILTQYNHPTSADCVSTLAFQSEIVLHGTPSGIDNTVIAFEEPVLFSHNQGIKSIAVKEPFCLVIGHTGISSNTRNTVQKVRQAYDNERREYEERFSEIGRLVSTAIACLREGAVQQLGPLMNRNHDILHSLGVSCPELDSLVEAACQAGALGAKMSGGGGGGIMVALTPKERRKAVARALSAAGAVRIIETSIAKSGPTL